MKMKLIIAVLSLVSLAFYVEESFDYPDYFPIPNYQFKNNPLEAKKIELGRILFYDPILSKDKSISCASCHSPFNAFAHTDHDLSHGINDEIGTRNAPALFNLAWQTSMMWDGAINHLDMQALAPISHPKEMDESIENVVNKLQAVKKYPSLFKEAFGDTLITGEFVLKALSQFQLTLVSAQSKYDQVKKGAETFTEQENKGYQLFQKHCNSCHQEPLFSNYTFANNGLPVDTTLNDFGRYQITKKSTDSLVFKIPSLRNLSYTYPYMHDGRFKKLRQVIKHYTSGIQESTTLSRSLQQGIPLSSNEQTDLIAFLLTLDDRSFVFDAKHQFPKIK